MSNHRTTRLRNWTSLLILLHLIASLLPVSTAHAAVQATNCPESTLAARAAAVVPAANQQVVISKEIVDFSVFQANWRTRYKDADALQQLLFVELLANMQAINDGERIYSVLNDWQTRFEQAVMQAEATDRTLLPYEAIIHMGLDEALKTPEMASAVPIVWEKMVNVQNLAQQGLTDTARIVQSGQRYDLGARILALAPDSAFTVFDCARKNSAIAIVFDRLNSDNLNASITDSAETILGNNPDLVIPTEIRGRINQDGTVSFSIEELKGLTAEEFERIHTSIGEIQESLIEIDKQQDVIIDYINDQELKAKHQALVKKKAAEHQLKVDAAKASVSILSTIIGQIDPKLGKQVGTIGNSSIQVYEALNGWLKAVAGLKGLDKVFSLSTVVMTGNVLGAVMNVVGLFGDSQPSLDQLILEEIGKLRQQVDQLRVEMHDRFDRIDQELNTIYTTMHDRFNQIDLELGKIDGNLQEVQESLVTLDLKLSRIERNNFDLINAVGRRPLLEAINGGLGYRQRTGTPMPLATFTNIENQFHSWATLHAFDAGNAGPTQRDYSDAGLLTELNAYPIDANLNYLNGWLVTHNLPAIASKPLPSPRDWLLASRAYAQLALEEPEQMATFIKNDPQRQARLSEIGGELETAMDKLSTLASTTGPLGNSLLFTTVITYYEGKLATMDGAIQTKEGDFLKEVREAGLQRSESFDLYGGPTQAVSYQTPELTTLTCGNADVNGAFATPVNMKAHIPNFEHFNFADYLRLGKITVCVDDSWVDVHDICTPSQAQATSGICPQFFGKHRALITVLYDNTPILTQWVTDTGDSKYDTASHKTKVNWTAGKNYKAQFETLFAITPPSGAVTPQQAQLLDATLHKIETALGTYQQAFYGRVVNELNQGSLKPAANEVAGSKLLLETFVSLGLPRAVSGDEFLHAMLFGDQRLVDDNQILQSYALSATQPITGTDLLVNPRLLINQVADQRTTAFAGMLDDYLAAIATQDHAEAADYIANTRRAFGLTMRIVQTDTEPAAALKRVYLPFVAR